MPLFQQSVQKKFIAELDKVKVENAYQKLIAHFSNPTIQENIRNAKEEEYQEGFVRDLFVNVFDYVLNPQPNFNFVLEKKNEKDSKKADGAILKSKGFKPLEKKLEKTLETTVCAVIELKSVKTTDLQSIEIQAFSYKNNQSDCVYVVTSNFQKIRFYIENAIDFEEFDLFDLSKERFALLYLCLQADSVLSDLPLRVKKLSLEKEESITNKLYADYSLFKQVLYKDILQNNQHLFKGLKPLGESAELDFNGLKPLGQDTEPHSKELQPLEEKTELHSKGFQPLVLYKKTQKLLDRFLFIFFAEDKGLLPPNSIAEILTQWDKLKELDEYQPLYNRFKKYFGYLNSGYKGKNYDIFAYNGGLFAPDELLDSLKITDNLLYIHCQVLAHYDFNTDVDTNILGHIFEHSLNEMDEISAESKGINSLEKTTSKRKKDGVFYTPRYITKYIVESTIGELCKKEKTALGLDNETLIKIDTKKDKKVYQDKIQQYRTWLLQLTILDPACGSGAFLNQALEFLIEEHRQVDSMTAMLFGDAMLFTDNVTEILEHNIFGVDINEESVEIARLSLWLRTAKVGRKLNDLSSNIKCGNSLISDTAVAGDLAFDWHKAFPKVFEVKDKRAFHVVLTTHNSRTSQRMITYNVQKGEPVNFDLEQEIQMTKIIGEIIKEKGYYCLEYNICKDHVHLVLVCEAEELNDIVKTIKGKSAFLYNKQSNSQSKGFQPLENNGIDKGLKPLGINNLSKGFQPLENQEEYIIDKGLKPLGINNLSKGVQPLENQEEYIIDKGLKPLGQESNSAVWSQKYFRAFLDDWQLMTLSNRPGWVYDDTYLENTLHYVKNNRIKHQLPASKELEKEITNFCVSKDIAYATDYKGGFDVVIGNPPYGAKIPSSHIDFLVKKYQDLGISKTFSDTYFTFTTLVIKDLLNKNGFLGFITPNSWRLIEAGIMFRKKLLSTVNISKIIQHTEKVFADATVDCDTFIIENAFDEKHEIQLIRKFGSDEISNFTTLQKSLLEYDYINLEISPQQRQLADKINKNSVFVKDVLSVKNGVKPYEKGKGTPPQTAETMLTKPFTSETKLDDTFLPLIGGSYFNKYKTIWNNDYWISYGKWLAAPRDKSIFFEEEEKLIFRQTSDTLIGTLISKGFVMRDNTHILLKINDLYDLKYVLALLNSKLANFMYWTINPEKGEALAQVKAFHLGMLPLKSIDKEAQQPFIALAEIMLQSNIDFQKHSTRFLKLFDNPRGLNPLNVNKKIENWYDMTFGEFRKELEKQKITIAIKELMDYQELFDTNKDTIQALKTNINQTEREIDKLVYQLYKLTPEEIQTIENN